MPAVVLELTHPQRRLCAALAVAAATALLSAPAEAGYTETAPEGTMLVDVGYIHSWMMGAYDNDGQFGALVDEIWRYEPGGGLQGVLIPDVEANYSLVMVQAMLVILDNLSFGLGVPIVANTSVRADFEWTSGDYQWSLGRPYSDEDFWQWAGSMGQPKPETWSGNDGTLSQIVLGTRLRWTDWIDVLPQAGWHSAVMVMMGYPTGSPPDPEQVLAAGTTLWDLQAQGDLAFHLGVDKTFADELDDRLRLGLDLFYEVFLPQRRTTPRGEIHPLLLNYAPYVGPSYKIDPGDFTGLSIQADVVPYRGPDDATGLTDGDEEAAAALPPVLSVALRYTYTYMLQSDWTSESELWDWDREKRWRPGYKNILTGRLNIGLYRFGVPLGLYAQGRTVSLLPGKNTPAAEVLSVGVQAPVPLW